MVNRGLYTAMVTPFHKDGSLDENTLRDLVEGQVVAGVAGVLACGTTGESPTLSYEEHNQVIEITIKQVNNRCQVMAGTGSNSTKEAICLTEHAKKLGATSSLQVIPYYNKPTQKGLYFHFKAIAEAVDIPIILYNIKGRTSVNLETATLVELAKIPNIVGVKEASGSIEQMMDVIAATPDDFLVFSGDDNLTLPLLAAGGDGLISVASNVLPRRINLFVQAGLNGDFSTMRSEFYALKELFKKIFIETNPIPVKTMLHLLGKCEKSFRLPLCEAMPETVVAMEQLIANYCK